MTDDHPPPVDPPGGPDMEPAFVLAPGVPYVRGWVDAHTALVELRAELAACGLVALVPYARADVTVAGVGVVDLGRVTPGTARRLAALLARARRADAAGTDEAGPMPPGSMTVIPRPRRAA